MPILNVNGREVHVQELNPEGKETLVLVHGMFSNLSVYYFHIAPVLATTFRVVMYDLKSHGLSGRVAEGYDLDSMSEDLEGLVDVLGLDTFHLAGYSFGGLIALNTALRLEARIRKLVVIEAPDPADEKARGIIDEYSREFLENYVKNYTDTTHVRMGKRQLERNHRMYEYLFYQTSIRRDMQRENDFFIRPELRALDRKTLLVYGDTSNCLDSGRYLHACIPGSELATLPGDHNLPIQEPELLADRLLTFLTT